MASKTQYTIYIYIWGSLCSSCALDVWRLTEGMCSNNVSFIVCTCFTVKVAFFTLRITQKLLLSARMLCSLREQNETNKKKSDCLRWTCLFFFFFLYSVCNKRFLFQNSWSNTLKKKKKKGVASVLLLLYCFRTKIQSKIYQHQSTSL